MGLSFSNDDDDEKEEEDDGLSFTDNDDEEEPDEDLELVCQYEGCSERFASHEDRTAHSLEEHWGINPEKYPTITGRGRFGWQA